MRWGKRKFLRKNKRKWIPTDMIEFEKMGDLSIKYLNKLEPIIFLHYLAILFLKHFQITTKLMCIPISMNLRNVKETRQYLIALHRRRKPMSYKDWSSVTRKGLQSIQYLCFRCAIKSAGSFIAKPEQRKSNENPVDFLNETRKINNSLSEERTMKVTTNPCQLSATLFLRFD